MNTNIQLKIRKLPKALAELSHSNQFMKASAFSAYGLCALLIIFIFVQSMRSVQVLTIAPDATVYQNATAPKPEVEIERAIREYIKFRYNWAPKTINSQLSKAGTFILPSTKRIYDGSMSDVVKFSIEKSVSQRAYPYEIKVDLKKGIVSVFGDRVTSIQGIKAAGDLRLDLTYESGPRTVLNPWGIYIKKEKEELLM